VDGTLWAWGRNSNAGQLGDGTTVDKNSPVQIGALTNWNQVAAGGYQTFSVKTDGTLWAWGSNTNGVLGQNNLVSRSSPVQVGALTNWSAVGTNFLNSANVFVTAVKTDGTLWAWGKNNLGQLGDGTVIDRSSPIQVGALTNWYQSSESGRATLAIKTDGTLWSWGGSANGTLGGGGYRSSPVQVGSEVNWLFVSGGQNHVAALQGDKTLWTWGSNSNGVLGRTGTAGVPGQVGSLTWTAVSAGTSATAAVN
jgi:alpha-tubulin suppressor-like RCC1 family protein